jgi:hypothetical protein
MRAPAIVPTITQGVRRFLAEQGAVLRPWAGLQETYDELYALLRRRRNDPGFWQPLRALLQQVIDSAVAAQGQANQHTELLASWKVDQLVDELRDTLPSDTAVNPPARAEFTRRLSSAVLGGFLLLGLAACGSDSTTSGTGGALGTGGSGGQLTLVGGANGTGGAIGTGGTIGKGGVMGTGGANGTGGTIGTGGANGTGGAIGTGGLAVDSGAGGMVAVDGAAPACTETVPAELDQAIGASSLADQQKSRLCQCFAALSTSWTTSLTQLFATGTPEQISKVLANLTSCCQPTGISTVHGLNAGPTSTDLQYIKDGPGYMLCAVPVYKGVSFPD